MTGWKGWRVVRAVWPVLQGGNDVFCIQWVGIALPFAYLRRELGLLAPCHGQQLRALLPLRNACGIDSHGFVG